MNRVIDRFILFFKFLFFYFLYKILIKISSIFPRVSSNSKIVEFILQARLTETERELTRDTNDGTIFRPTKIPPFF